MESPLVGASNAGEYENIAIFDQYLALSRKRYDIGPQLQFKTNIYLTLNISRQRHSYNGILIKKTCTRPTKGATML